MRKCYLLSNPQSGFPIKLREILKEDINTNDKNIVFLPCNYRQTKGNTKYHKINTEWFIECGVYFKNNILLTNDMSKNEIKEYIKSADILFIMGGQQLEQIKFCYIKDIFEDIMNFDGLIIGICAGAINMADKVSSLYLSNMYNPIQTFYKGFSFLDFNILPHIEKHSQITLTDNKYVILPDESFVVFKNNQYKVYGEYQSLYFDVEKINIENSELNFLLLNIVFINCSFRFKNLSVDQISEYKQLFKYTILKYKMNFDTFKRNFYHLKKQYLNNCKDNIDFLEKEYNFIKKSILEAKKYMNSNCDLTKDDLNNLIYDRYGVTINEISSFDTNIK